MSHSKKYDVILCGGGIGGLTASLALSARGIRSVIVERMSTATSHGSGLQLGPNACHVLTDLGLLSGLYKIATQPEKIVVRDLDNGSHITDIPLGKTAYKKYNAPYLLVHRSDLHLLLTKKAVEDPNIDFVSDFFADRFIDHGNEVELFSARQESYKARALIGTDGIWSIIRRQLHGNNLPNNSGQIAWRTLVPTSSLPDHWKTPQTGLWLGKHKHLVTYPVKMGEYLNLILITKGIAPGQGWSEVGDKQELLNLLGKVDSNVKSLIEAAPVLHLWQLFDRDPLPQWGEGNVSLLGDAAHPMLPHLAQGAGMAIEDAYVLAHTLAASPQNFATALRNYEKLRITRTSRVQKASRKQSKNYQLTSVQGKMRNMALGLAGKFMPTKVLDQYDWLYAMDLPGMISGSEE